jgi:hypothetical protein
MPCGIYGDKMLELSLAFSTSSRHDECCARCISSNFTGAPTFGFLSVSFALRSPFFDLAVLSSLRELSSHGKKSFRPPDRSFRAFFPDYRTRKSSFACVFRLRRGKNVFYSNGDKYKCKERGASGGAKSFENFPP